MIEAPPEQAPDPVKSSARIRQPQNVGNLNHPAKQPSSPQPANYPAPGSSTDHPEPGGFPQLAGIHWEPKKTGAVEAWYSADTTRRNRASRQYLGQLGKKRMTEINTLTPGEASAELRRWVVAKAAEKGIKLGL